MTNPEFRDIDCATEFCDTRYEGADLAQRPSPWCVKTIVCGTCAANFLNSSNGPARSD